MSSLGVTAIFLPSGPLTTDALFEFYLIVIKQLNSTMSLLCRITDAYALAKSGIQINQLPMYQVLCWAPCSW